MENQVENRACLAFHSNFPAMSVGERCVIFSWYIQYANRGINTNIPVDFLWDTWTHDSSLRFSICARISIFKILIKRAHEKKSPRILTNIWIKHIQLWRRCLYSSIVFPPKNSGRLLRFNVRDSLSGSFGLSVLQGMSSLFIWQLFCCCCKTFF